jgi:hypothetical protein
MNSVRLFCDRVVVLEKGEIAFDGKPDDAIAYYLEQEEKKKSQIKKKSQKPPKPFYGDIYHNEAKITDVRCKWHKTSYRLHETMILNFSFRIHHTPKNLVIGIPVWNGDGDLITSFNSDFDKITFTTGDGFIRGQLQVRCMFNPGEYLSVIAVVDNGEFLYRNTIERFDVLPKERVFGCVTFVHEWKITND